MAVEQNVARNSYGIGAIITVAALTPIFIIGFTEVGELITQLITSKITTM